GEMTSIGTLLAFILVCFGILIMRKTMPDVPRAFKTPFVPFVPILGIITCLFMMIFLPIDTWIRLLVWMTIGLDVYMLYGFKSSKLRTALPSHQDILVLQITGHFLSVLLAVVVLWRQQCLGWQESKTLTLIALTIVVINSLIIFTKIRKTDPTYL
ncbi:MAG: amino acid permease C-terminal domain-containing protein, partial [Bacteroidales bacterium]